MNCYLLIGGESRRMGRSKVDLFLQRTVAAAHPTFDNVIAVQRHGGDPASIVPTIFEEPHDERAPVFGVLRALDEVQGRAFVLAVDYPLITTEALRVIRDRIERSHAPLVVPQWSGKPQMLCAGYDASLVPRIRERIAGGRLDLRGLIDEAPGEIIAEHGLRALLTGDPLRNVNTPEELEEIDERL